MAGPSTLCAQHTTSLALAATPFPGTFVTAPEIADGDMPAEYALIWCEFPGWWRERVYLIDNQLVRVRCIAGLIKRSGLVPWEF